MEKEVIEILNQELMNRVKEIRDILGLLEVDLNVANRAAINALTILSDRLAMDYVNRDIADFSKTTLKNTHAMRSLLTFVDEIARDLLQTVSSPEETELV